MDVFLRVFLKSSAGEVELSTHDLDAPYRILDGTRGFGLPQRSLESSPIASGNGSALRSQRFDETEMMLPISIRGSDASDVATKARELEHILMPASNEPIEIRVVAPQLSTTRRRFIYYTGGLEGAIGSQDSHWVWRHAQVTFQALDPMWYGRERVIPQRVDQGRKPFITSKVDPVPTGRRNLWRGSKLSEDRSALSGSRWESNQQTDEGWEITGGDPGTGAYSFVYTTTAYRVPVESDVPYSWAIPVKNTGDVPIPVRITSWLERSTSGSVSASAAFTLEPGETRVAKLENMAADNAKDIRFSLYYGANDPKVPAGGKITLLDGITLVADEVAADPVNGDSSGWGWAGERGNSESIEFEASSMQRVPFFPIVLASSVIEGAYQLKIQGDANAWPIWEVTGPGEDLLIENIETEEQIFIRGKFGEKVTIDTRPTIADIYSETDDDGELWERVDDDYQLFPLKPGLNKIKITMVNSRPHSLITLRYSETWLAGW